MSPLKFTVPSTDRNVLRNYDHPATVPQLLPSSLGGRKEPQIEPLRLFLFVGAMPDT